MAMGCRLNHQTNSSKRKHPYREYHHCDDLPSLRLRANRSRQHSLGRAMSLTGARAVDGLHFRPWNLFISEAIRRIYFFVSHRAQ